MPSPKNEPPRTTFDASELSPQVLLGCMCPPDSTALGCMQVRHQGPPIFDDSDVNGDDGVEAEECGCACHHDLEEDDE